MRTLFVVIFGAASAFAADIAVSIGTGPSTSSVQIPGGTFTGASSTAAVLVDGSARVFGIGPASINLDVPLLFGGPSNAKVAATSGLVVAYADRMQFALTPGLKARFNLGLVAPWVSFGVGGARMQQSGSLIPAFSTGTAQAGNTWNVALSPAGGIDFKPLPFVFFRGEVRSYVLRTPTQVFNTGIDPFTGNWRNNLLFLAGVGLRF